MVLRNIVPRQGTETKGQRFLVYALSNIEKYSSPTGDGNNHHYCTATIDWIEKYSSPTGDGNTLVVNVIVVFDIIKLRNIVPRQGTETVHVARTVYGKNH